MDRVAGPRAGASIWRMVIAASAQVLIVEDHPLYSDGLVHLLARHAPQLQCQVAADAAQALDLLSHSASMDLLLVDHCLPGTMDGLGLLERVGQLYPTAGRVLMSGLDDPQLAAQARRLGAMGFLPKTLPPPQWLAALETVLAGEPWFAPPMAGPVSGLTPRQVMILQRIAQGCTNKLIARELAISERTIKYHLTEVFSRLNASSRAEAVARATALGWLVLARPVH